MHLRFVNTHKVALIIIALVGLLAILFPHFAPSIYIYYAIFALIGALWAMSLNFFMGYCGQINFGVAGFGCIAAYSLALMVTELGIPNLIALLLSVVVTCLVTYIVSFPLLRLRDVVLGLGTLAFSLALYTAVATGFTGITGGEDGLSLPPVILLGKTMGDMFYFYVSLFMVVLCYFISHNLIRSRTGRAMRAIAQDERAARSMGIHVPTYWRLALILNGLFAGFAGALYAQWSGWVSPAYFSLHQNILVLLALIIGGSGSALGCIFGGMIMFLIPHFLSAFEEWQTLIYGIILILLLRFAPWGIAGVSRSLIFRFLPGSGKRD